MYNRSHSLHYVAGHNAAQRQKNKKTAAGGKEGMPDKLNEDLDNAGHKPTKEGTLVQVNNKQQPPEDENKRSGYFYFFFSF